jgi:acyl-CoA thioesterase FadM
MEDCEHAFVRSLGLSVHGADPEGRNIGFVRAEASCSWHAPLRFEEEFQITLTVIGGSERTVRYAFVVQRGDLVVASGAMIVVCVLTDASPMRAVGLPAVMAEIVTRILGPFP